MDATRPVGVAIIGLGTASKPHALALKALAPRVEVRAVFARDPGRRAAFANLHGWPEATSVEAIATDPAISVVIVLTPPNARVQLVEKLAAAGKHILMEKPVERTTAGAETIVAACDRFGVTLGIVFQHRYRAGALRLKSLLDAGSLGAIGSVRLNVPWWRPQAGYYDEPGRGTLERDGGGVLMTQAIHPLDLMLSLVGPVSEVQAIAGTTPIHRMETEDFVGAGLRFANGALGSLSATTAACPGAGEQLAVDCLNGTAILDTGELTIRWHDGRTDRHGDPAGAGGGGADTMAFPHDWHQALILAFLDSIGAGRKPVPSGRDALRVHDLIDALLASSGERRAVMVRKRDDRSAPPGGQAERSDRQ